MDTRDGVTPKAKALKNQIGFKLHILFFHRFCKFFFHLPINCDDCINFMTLPFNWVSSFWIWIGLQNINLFLCFFYGTFKFSIVGHPFFFLATIASSVFVATSPHIVLLKHTYSLTSSNSSSMNSLKCEPWTIYWKKLNFEFPKEGAFYN